jgi:predicted RNase H-like HicB family nuclease
MSDGPDRRTLGDTSDGRGHHLDRSRRIGMATTVYTAIIEKEGNLYAALCPELDVASQGTTVEEATSNLREAVELFLECADPQEVKRRLRTDVFVTRIEARHG